MKCRAFLAGGYPPRRLILARKLKVLAFSILCLGPVALAGTNFIDGQVFIVTGGHESVKLGLVAIAACRPDEFTSAVGLTKSQIESERAKLDDIRLRADESVAAASQLEDAVSKASILPEPPKLDDIRPRADESVEKELKELAAASQLKDAVSKASILDTLLSEYSKLKVNAENLADRVRRRTEYLNSAGPYFKNLPRPIALVKTDVDGKFKLELPSSIDQVIIVASATREVFGPRENYFWAVKVKPPATIMLSNDNLADAASSDSALQTLALTGVPDDEDTADNLKAAGRNLAADAEKILRDFQSNTGSSVEMPGPPTPRSLEQMITLTQPVSMQLTYGTVTLPVGTKLKFVSKVGTEVHVRYLNSDQMIPISATDLK